MLEKMKEVVEPIKSQKRKKRSFAIWAVSECQWWMKSSSNSENKKWMGKALKMWRSDNSKMVQGRKKGSIEATKNTTLHENNICWKDN